MAGVQLQVTGTGVKHQVWYCYPPSHGSHPRARPKRPQKHVKKLEPYSPLNDFTAKASSESVRGPQNIGKRKLRVSDGPKTLENVGSNHSWAAQHLPWASRAILAPARALPKPSQRPPRSLQRPSWDSKCFPEQVTSQQSQSSSDQPGATSDRKQASDIQGPKKRGRRQEAEGP